MLLLLCWFQVPRWLHGQKKPIQIIVPWGAGGNTDTVARPVAEGLQKRVESECQRGESHGGAGVVGHDAIAKAKADGYAGIATVEITMMHHQDDGVNVSELHANYTAGSESGRRKSQQIRSSKISSR